METVPDFPSNKRYAMHFRQKSPSDHFIRACFPNPKFGHLSPSNVSITTHHAPESMEEAPSLPQGLPKPPPYGQNDQTYARQPLSRSQSSSYWMEIRKSQYPKREPCSRKKNAATIITDPTDTQPAFESDAFAVQMPTTREPILDPPIFRAKLPSSSKYAQAEAYQTYKRKADQERERQQFEGVQVPSKIVSYDYASRHITAQPLESEVSHLNNPAGAFPISPPVPQQEWTKNEQTKQDYKSMSISDYLSLSQKPEGLGNIQIQGSRVHYQHGDASAGAITSNLRSMPQQPSPSKPSTIKNSPVEPVFGFTPNDIDGTVAGASKLSPRRLPKESPKLKAKGKDNEKNKDKVKGPSRWAWLRPTGPRVQKPTIHAVPADTKDSNPAATRTTGYVNPFNIHTTPLQTNTNNSMNSRPLSPKKLLHSIPLRPTTPTPIPHSTTEEPSGKFETGFTQVTTFTSLLFKICLVVYALVGLYFLLDAVREAVYALGAPFRMVRVLGRVGVLICKAGWVFKLKFLPAPPVIISTHLQQLLSPLL
ncbi:hypothetical protein B0J11DRAFT_508005 [Dendryphion nanum]|uniref:Uncharacterized protein n=1 Tax=Dendryphion nanum TaxID=256645 RepID=A0A9P9IHM8_9PLEO|nr:hypothetical protein B0J11DRAFT_508005 [Dendryphion nanum]